MVTDAQMAEAHKELLKAAEEWEKAKAQWTETCEALVCGWCAETPCSCDVTETPCPCGCGGTVIEYRS